MEKVVISWLVNLTLFSLFSTIVIKLLPGKAYTPYARFFSGLISIIIFLDPLLSGIGVADKLEAAVSGNLFSLEAKEMESELLRMEEGQKEHYQKAYGNEMERQIFAWADGEGYPVKDVECVMAEGRVKRVSLFFYGNLTQKEKKAVKNHIEDFYQVKVGNIDIKAEDEDG